MVPFFAVRTSKVAPKQYQAIYLQLSPTIAPHRQKTSTMSLRDALQTTTNQRIAIPWPSGAFGPWAALSFVTFLFAVEKKSKSSRAHNTIKSTQ
jgi:hypothetical protein